MTVPDLIIDLGLPLPIVDHPTFLRAMNTIYPRFTVLSRRTLCREILPSVLEQVMIKPQDDEDEHYDESEALEYKKNNMNDQEERLRIPCFSHTLQLTVGDGLKECENAKPALAKVAAIAKLR
ncbi:unnamed protein product [Rotaria sp. Silwood1]|nr:unnamed protein product [Rotaria sp. Silwood1]